MTLSTGEGNSSNMVDANGAYHICEVRCSTTAFQIAFPSSTPHSLLPFQLLISLYKYASHFQQLIKEIFFLKEKKSIFSLPFLNQILVVIQCFLLLKCFFFFFLTTNKKLYALYTHCSSTVQM